jgi:glycosyltransferase involved in cell wall biosynthesis
MSDRELSTITSRPVSAAPVIPDDHSPCIVVFVAGEQSRVETAIYCARQLYPDHPRVFICEPAHQNWILPAAGERVFVIEQPFNPFGQGAAALRTDLEASPIEACALVIAGVGLESLRFRVFALRLRTPRFLLLRGHRPNDSTELDRFSFALLTGVTLPLGQLRKIERKTLVGLSLIGPWLRELLGRIPRAYRFIRARLRELQGRILGAYDRFIRARLRELQGRILGAYDRSIGAWLRELPVRVVKAYDKSIGAWLGELREAYGGVVEELFAMTEEALTQAVAVQRLSGMERGGAGNVKHKLKFAVASLGIRQLDKRYRRIFQDLFREPWERWFDSRNVSGESITLVVGTLGPGGSERQAVATLLGLASRGYSDLSLLCNYLDGPVDRFFAHLLEGCPVSISEVSEDFRDPDPSESVEALGSAGLTVLMEKLPSELKDIPWYAQAFLATRPRIVHAWLDYTNVKAGLAAALIGIPRIVLSTRSVAPNNFALFQPYMREAYRILAAHPTVCLLNNSEAGARDYERWLGLPRGTFKVVRNGFDFSQLEPAEKSQEAREFRARLGVPLEVPLVGSVLRFSEEKCPLFWIDVAARVAGRQPEVRFLMVGDGPLWEEARRRVEACGLGDRIVMPGNEKDAAIAIAAMDVFLLTSRLEGLPNALIEAQALGVPVVTTDGGGSAETLIQGTTGYAIFPHSADLLADAVLRILGNRAWRERAGQAAQRFVRERFSMSQMVDRTLDAYFARGEFAAVRAAHRPVPDTVEATS